MQISFPAPMERLRYSQELDTGNLGNVADLDDAVAAFSPAERIKGKTIIRAHL